MSSRRGLLLLPVIALLLLTYSSGSARNPIRNAFFDVYPTAENTRLDDLPSNSSHCGVCHFDFDGGGPRNPYGFDLQVAIGQFSTYQEAVLSLDADDSDNDGHVNSVEITDATLFSNTPTFPGLTTGNVGEVSNVNLGEIQDHLTPSGGTDITPPDVTVLTPNGGESFQAGSTQAIDWIATDASGIARVDIDFSDDGGTSYEPLARDEDNDGEFDWFVPNPGTAIVLRVLATDNAGNAGSDVTDAQFTVLGTPPGVVPTTLRDFKMAGTQPFEGGVLEEPNTSCAPCHGNYDPTVEPWFNTRGSMMGQAMRDPLFLATMVIAEQDAPSSGDLCLRCHTPGGWQEGRSIDTSGGMLTAKDREGVQCDACHRFVDPIYQAGVSPIEDLPILDSLEAIPLTHANGQFVGDPDPIRRGPFPDPLAAHAFIESPFHRESDICGTCHDVSNPAFVAGGAPGVYVPSAFDAPHPDGDLRNMMPVERTYSEWSVSEYATSGVYAPQFAGNKPDGIVSTCQDCHMRDVVGRGCNDNQAPVRDDLPLHDLTGGNYFIGDLLPEYYPGEVDPAQLQAGKQRAIDMLQLAASLDLTAGQAGANPTVEVKVTNETGHKLPSGYPEGRRVWLNVVAYDESQAPIYESGAYDPATGELTHDEDLKIYEIHPGVSTSLAGILGVEAGPSFHFVLSDTVYVDNRIPPRGFTHAAFEQIQSPPVPATYADGEHWDTTLYVLPIEARFVEVRLFYQSTSKEYIEFLRDENVTNDAGQILYDAWVAHGRAAPVTMVTDTLSVTVNVAVHAPTPALENFLLQNVPNPFNPSTTISYSTTVAGPVHLQVFDPTGRLVRTLVDEQQESGPHTIVWNGRDDTGARVSSGVYLYRISTVGFAAGRKAILLQ